MKKRSQEQLCVEQNKKKPASQEIFLTDRVASASVRWNFLRGKRERQFPPPLEFQKYYLNKLHPQHSEENTKCSPWLPQLAPLISFSLLFLAKAAHSGASGIWLGLRVPFFSWSNFTHIYLQHCCHFIFFFLHNWNHSWVWEQWTLHAAFRSWWLQFFRENFFQLDLHQALAVSFVALNIFLS